MLWTLKYILCHRCRSFVAQGSKFVSRAIDRYDKDVAPALIHEIDQLEAMRLADVAWHEVDTTTTLPVLLTSLVPVSSFLNSEPLEGVDCAEKDISDLPNQLEELDVFCRKKSWIS